MNSKSQISQKNSKNCELGNHFFSHVPKLQNWAFALSILKLCVNCAFSQNFDTNKLGEIPAFYAVVFSKFFVIFQVLLYCLKSIHIVSLDVPTCVLKFLPLFLRQSTTLWIKLLEPPPKVAPPSFSCRLLPSSLEIQTLSYLIFKKITVFSQKEIYNCWLNLIPRNTSILTHLLTH